MHSMWRDLKAWEYEGLPLTTPSNEAAKMYDATLTQYTGFYNDPEVGGIEGSVTKMLTSDPDFFMGNIMGTTFQFLGNGSSVSSNPALKSALEKLTSLSDKQNLTEREKKHFQAVKLWSDDKLTQATDIWEDILVDYPTDLLALKYAYEAYFGIGWQPQMKDCVAKVLPSWKKEIPLYGYLHGMYGFALVENNYYRDGEKCAHKSLELNQRDGWATHTLSHIVDFEGRHREGIDFLEKTENNWEKDSFLACHNYWHWALNHIEFGEYEAALEIYDKQIFPRGTSGQISGPFCDAASFLYRMNMEGVDVGDRWKDVYGHCEKVLDDHHIQTFRGIHILMATLATKNEEATTKYINALKAYISEHKDSLISNISSEFGIPLFEAFQAFDKGDFAESFEILYPLRYKLVNIGFSNAQRDLFNQMIIHAAINSSNKTHNKLARGLIYERKGTKLSAPLTDRLLAKFMLLHTE